MIRFCGKLLIRDTTSGKTTWASNGDFLGLAIDCDNNAIYAHVNGTYVDSGDPTSGASKTEIGGASCRERV